MRRTEARKSRSPRRLNFLPTSPEPFRRGGLEADEDAPAAGPPGQRHELLVVGEVDRDLGDPLLAQIRLRHGAEQVFGARHVLGSRADQIVVHHEKALLADQAELPHHVRDGSLPVLRSVDRRHAAEAAAERAATSSLDGAEEVAVRQEIVTCEWDALQVAAPAVIAMLQRAPSRVVEHPRPDALGLPRHDRVHALHDLLRARGGVDAAHHDGDTEAAEVGGHLVGTVGL